MEDNFETVQLNYTIHKFSSYSVNFQPQSILQNAPADGLSRWFTDNPSPNQFLVLKLQSPAIVETIKFGKYIKSHVSNLRRFQILGGTEEDNLTVILRAGLKNDTEPEIFKLRHKTQDGLYMPVMYIKIVPLQSWGPAYNYSIWYVELLGTDQEDFVSQCVETINLRKEEEAVRILLKHLRRRRYKDAFEALSRESGVQLEGPMQSRLWNALVEQGDFALTEQIFTQAASEGELDWYLSWQPYKPVWREITPCSVQVEAKLSAAGARSSAPTPTDELHSVDRDAQAEGSLEDPADGDVEMGETGGASGCCGAPGPRGGHQLVLDPDTGTLYLFGGWNGTEDLDDLWSWHPARGWRQLCQHSAARGGPGPRSCHKMVCDPARARLYLLGRYLDNAQRVPQLMKSELFAFYIATGEWALLCEDTATVGGPRLVFDHQMCIDADTQTIYVFGGRILPANTEEAANPQYSGLYAYYIATNTWQLLLPDKHSLPAPQSRVSHSMLFHPTQRRLYILAGQRHKQHLAELWAWDALTGQARALCAAPPAHPPQGFTQRATIDAGTDEIHVLAGMNKEKERRVYNTLWVFSLRRRAWSAVWSSEGGRDQPRPRFAHQLVYDTANKIHYLFGGNPGNHNHPRVRLDDLWSLELLRPSAEDVLKRAAAAIREACYKEMCSTNPEGALHYLRTAMNEVVDHSDATQVSNFQKLPSSLFSHATAPPPPAPLDPPSARALARRRADVRATTDHSHDIKQVLGGSEETVYIPIRPTEDIPSPPEPDTWDVGVDEEVSLPADWAARHARVALYDALCQYFRPSAVPPESDVMQLVKL